MAKSKRKAPARKTHVAERLHFAPTQLKVLEDAPGKPYSLRNIRNKVILGDALDVMGRLPEASVDLVFIDPPYFLQLPKKELKRWKVRTDVQGVEDGWDKFDSFQHYDGFLKDLLGNIKRVMKDTATLWLIGTYHSIHRSGHILQDLGYWLLNNVVWVKRNPMPNWLGVRFTNATETLIWAAKSKNAKGCFFDRHAAKEFGFGNTGDNVWVLPICRGKERLRDEEGKKVHSTQKPLELLRRIMLTSTKKGDLVLDPVAGTGTTGYAAKALGRHFVMVEREKRYVEWMRKRFAGNP